MSDAATPTDPRLQDNQGIAGHPRGLMVLFFTEMWERFSYYGMRALLLLYMTLEVAKGGLGFSDKRAAVIYGFYTFGVYILSLPAGLVADRWLGYRRAVLVGGVFIALGEFCLAIGGVFLFYTGLTLIILGTGLLKTNCTTLVGKLYGDGDHRRDAGFSIYYMGINIGAFVAPLILGFMAQDPRFVAFLGRYGIGSANGWRWAFGLAGLAMVAGLVQYLLQQHKLGKAGLEAGARVAEHGHASAQEPLTPEEKKRMSVVFILFLFSMLFWATFEQAGSTLNLFADRLTDCRIGSWSFPSTWYQSVNSIWLLILAPLISALWVKLGSKEPSSPVKFAVGLFLVGLGMLILVPPSKVAATGVKVGPWWLVGTYFLHTVGELCLSPVGLSTTSKLAPARYAGLMMGVWFASIALGNLLAGFAASLFASLNPAQLFAALFGVTTAATVILLLLSPMIRRLMGSGT